MTILCNSKRCVIILRQRKQTAGPCERFNEFLEPVQIERVLIAINNEKATNSINVRLEARTETGPHTPERDGRHLSTESALHLCVTAAAGHASLALIGK